MIEAAPADALEPRDLELVAGAARAMGGGGFASCRSRARRAPPSRGGRAGPRRAGSACGTPSVDPTRSSDPGAVRSLLALAWLLGDALFLPHRDGDRARLHAALAAARAVPVTLFVAVHGRCDPDGIPPAALVPALTLRRARLRGPRRPLAARAATASRPRLDGRRRRVCARRFRYEQATIRAVAGELNALGRAPDAGRAPRRLPRRGPIDCGDLAQPVEPRFDARRAGAAAGAARQLEEIHRGDASLTAVHYEWGTARAWNESGIAVLFAGPPGTGKTMAAEVLARRAGPADVPHRPLAGRQQVHRRDREEPASGCSTPPTSSDVILFFDEADALFGKRTEVRDAHDRYANLEISYLLERMERFKGLAILATNRQARTSTRRSCAGCASSSSSRCRARRAAAHLAARDPRAASTPSALDFEFLARQFPLAGGHIRSIVFNACLQTAAATARRARSTMQAVVRAVQARVRQARARRSASTSSARTRRSWRSSPR